MIKPMRLANRGIHGPGIGWTRPLNKRTRSLVEAFMMAAEAAGDPSNRGKGGPAGYFKSVAAKHPRAFVRLWTQILLLQKTGGQHQGSPDSPIRSLFDAILMAPAAVGDPSNRGKGGAAGYFKWLLAKHPLAYLSVLEHILPLQMINEQCEQELPKIKEILVERIMRKLKELKREESDKSRADQDRINATAPQGGVGQRPRLTESGAHQHCTDPAREHGMGQRPRLNDSRADQDCINATAPKTSSRTSAAAGLSSEPARSQIPVQRSAAQRDFAGTVAACRYLSEL